MSNAVLVIQWEEVMVNVDSFYKLRNEQEIDIYSNANYQLIEPNRLLFKFVKNISKDIPIIIFTLYHRSSIAQQHCQYFGLQDNSNISYARLFSPGYYSARENKLEDLLPSFAAYGFTDFFFVANHQAYNAIEFRLTPFKNQTPEALFHNMLPYMGRNGYWFFEKFSKEASPDLVSTMNFVNSDVGIGNIIALENNDPTKTVFFRHTYPLDLLAINHRYYLLDYYSISKGTVDNPNYWNNPISHEIISEIKDNSRHSYRLSSFFCESLIHYIESSNVDLNSCAFMIMPSHSTEKWNKKLYDTFFAILTYHGWNKNTLKGLIRKYQVEEQHTKKCQDRTTDPLIASLAVSSDVELSQFSYVILVDDIVTSGTSFDAASKVIRNSGFTGIIKSFAVAGTRKSFTGIISEKLPFIESQKSPGNIGFIFDLDNTLIDTDAIKPLRDAGRWQEIRTENTTPFWTIINFVKKVLFEGNDVAIVTSSPKTYCIKMLAYIGIQINEVIIVASGDAENKPSEKPYLLATSKMEHNNKNIICVGDEYNDMLACENANKADKDRKYLPIHAGWINHSQLRIPHSHEYLNKYLVECPQEYDFIRFANETLH